MKIHFGTRYGDYYDVTEEGYIIRLDQKDFIPSGQWKFLGLEKIKDNFGHTEFIPFKELTRERIMQIREDLRFKNGNPRYTVRDLDHGTVRVWGNVKAHGITSLSMK